MIAVLRRHKERKAWEERIRRQLDGLLVPEQNRLSLPVAGPPAQKDELLRLYRRLLEPAGYRLRRVEKTDDIWTAQFEKAGSRDGAQVKRVRPRERK